MIALDSDVAIDVLRGIAPALEWFRLRPRDEVIVIPGYVAMELIWGTRDAADQRNTEKWLAQFETVWLEPASCHAAYQTLLDVHLRNAIDPIDVLIGHVALSLGVPLCTFNEKHFNVIPGLKIVRPYSRNT